MEQINNGAFSSSKESKFKSTEEIFVNFSESLLSFTIVLTILAGECWVVMDLVGNGSTQNAWEMCQFA